MSFYVKKKGIVFDEFCFCVSEYIQDEYMTIATVNTYDTSCALSNDPILFIIISISILNSFLIFFFPDFTTNLIFNLISNFIFNINLVILFSLII